MAARSQSESRRQERHSVMSDWRVRVDKEGESPLHAGWGGKSLDMGADCWRLGIGAGMAVSEATDNRHRNNGQSWKSLGYAKPRLGRLGRLGKKTWQISQKIQEAEQKHHPLSLSLALSLSLSSHFSFPLQSLPWDWGICRKAEMQRPDSQNDG